MDTSYVLKLSDFIKAKLKMFKRNHYIYNILLVVVQMRFNSGSDYLIDAQLMKK